MLSINDFYESFIQGVLSNSDSRGILKPEAFLEEISTYLIDDAELSDNFQIADYKKTGIEVHGYDYNEERRILTLVVHEFFQQDTIQTLPLDTLKTKIKRIKSFFEKAINGLHTELEESSLAYSMSYDIYSKRNDIENVRFMVITDAIVSTRSNIDLPSEKIGQYNYEYKVFDINSIYKIFQSKSDQDFNINIEEITGEALPCIKAPTQSDDYDSYLTVMPGKLLYQIYDMFGQKLLEENVRTFLQFKGKVNQGLRITIKENPEMFFAYNNGLTTTAKHIELEDDHGIQRIKAIEGLQIVNGGQTTSAIYASSKNGKLNIDNIYVQMKLSVIKNPNKHHDFVSKISEYANTQNKVNKSDFFANSPFHKDFKEHSTRIYAPTKDGSQRKTRWFYERARGQYLNEQAYLTDSNKKQFLLEYPKEQMIDKTMLAKSENSWRMVPWAVCKGAQFSFVKFADDVTKLLDQDELAITEKYFKDAVTKIIIFKATEKLISNSDWYDGGYRAQTVAYSISLLADIFKRNNKNFNFSIIWEKQSITDELKKVLTDLTKRVYESITTPPSGIANVGEWCKKDKCWDCIKSMEFNDSLNFISEYAIDKEDMLYEKKEAKKVKVIDNSVQMQSLVIQTKPEVWMKLYSHFSKYKDTITPTEYGVLSSMAMGRIKFPSINQSKVLYKIYTMATKLGMNL